MDPLDIFKKRDAPAANPLKRKLTAPQVPDLKSVRQRTDGPEHDPVTSSTNGISSNKGKEKAQQQQPRRVTLEVEEVEDDDDDENPYDFAPNGDADYFREEDEDGRFYGGGLTSTQKDILDIMDTDPSAPGPSSSSRNATTADGREGEPEALTLVGARKHLLNLEKAINKNTEMRTRFADEPTRFVDSEYDLTVSLHSLLLLTQSPSTFYPELIRLNTMASLTSLLSHENVDIACSVVETLEELLDDDIGEEVDEPARDQDDEDEDRERTQNALRGLVKALLDNSALDLLVDNLKRLDENEEAERSGIYHTLGLFENLTSLSPPFSATLLSHPSFISFILPRIKKRPSSQDLYQNRYYIAELLAILLQAVASPNAMTNDEGDKVKEGFGKAGGVEALLMALSYYRRRDPADSDEVEFMENIFDALCSALSSAKIKEQFLENEGVELMVIMMKEKKLARTRSIKVLDHALAGETGGAICERFVEALGLKTLFSAFMGKGNKKQPKAFSSSTIEDEEHIFGILVSLLTNLASESSCRIRLLAKFVEEGYEKVDRLVESRDQVETRVASKEKEVQNEKRVLASEGIDMNEDEEYFRRLEGGLFCLQMIDYIIGWICMEDDGIQDHISMLLRRKGRTFKDVVKVLREYADVGEPTSVTPEGMARRDVIYRLADYLSEQA